jgi:hypothetical protein
MQLHYKPKKVSEIRPKDSRIALIGKVFKTGGNSFVLDDNTGKVEIVSDMVVERNKMIRVFCSLVEEKLKADIIQSLEGLDLNLFKKTEELYNKVL